MTNVNLDTVLAEVQKPETFETDDTIFFTHQVDPEYEAIVTEMARAIYQHDNTLDAVFPTGNVAVDSPYLCKADDALREALPLLRNKIAADVLKAVEKTI